MLLKAQPRLVVFMILQLLLSSCLQRSVVKNGSIPHPNVTSKKTQLELGDYIRSVYKVEQENSAQAEEQRKKVLDTRPELAELSARIAANGNDIDARKTLAAAYLQEGLLWNAYALYEEIRNLVPADFDAELGLARIWDKWADNGLAGQYAATAISINPASADAHDLMAKIALHGNAANQAIAEFKLALQLNPDQPVVFANLGYAYMLAGNSTEARAAFEKALSLDSTLVEARNNLGILLAQAGDYNGAFAQMQQVGKPEVALNNIGALLLFENKGVEAAEVLKQALQYDPNYEKAKENLSIAQSLVPPPAFVNLPPFVERTELPPAPDPAAESARRLSETVVHVDPGVLAGRINSADVKDLALLRLPEPVMEAPIQPPTEVPRFASDLQKSAPVVAADPSAKAFQSGVLRAAEPVVSLPIQPAIEASFSAPDAPESDPSDVVDFALGLQTPQPEATLLARAQRSALQAEITATDKELAEVPEPGPVRFTPLQPVAADILLSPETALTFLIVILMTACVLTLLRPRIPAVARSRKSSFATSRVRSK